MTTNMQKENKEIASEMQAVPNGQAVKNEPSGTAAIKSSDKPKFNEHWLVVLAEILLVPCALAFLAWGQFQITNTRQDADNADKEMETKEHVLSDYSKTIQELLVTRNSLGTNKEGAFVISKDQRNIARGHTLIALRRLNVADTDEKDGLDWLPQPLEDGLDWLVKPLKIDCWYLDGKDEADCFKRDNSKADSGKLRGLLIRYLYDAQLIGYGYSSPAKPAMISLAGADINNVVLRDAWLPRIDLHNAWLEKSDFGNASLWRANLKDARLTGANLAGTDLRFAKLTSATLEKATLTGACYVKGSEAELFPSDFDPAEYGMIAILEEQSDPSKPNFERCPSVVQESL
jgi:Pentapeptide repeats (8 copies)